MKLHFVIRGVWTIYTGHSSSEIQICKIDYFEVRKE